jgi:hypothetical protein
MLVSLKMDADFSRGVRIGESATCFSRPTPAFPRFAICSRWYCVDLAGFCTITGKIKLLRLKGSWEEGATIYAAVLADPSGKKTRRRIMSEEKLRLTAYHEAGHAVASWVVGLEMEGDSIERQESSLGRVTVADIEAMEV